MHCIRDCLRLFYENKLNQSQISRILKISRSTVQDYLSRLTIASLSYDDCFALSDTELENSLYKKTKRSPIEPPGDIEFKYLHTELSKTGVTLRLLWEDYKRENQKGHQYSQFCFHYQQWKKSLKVYMHQHHIAGEKIFVDYSGKKPFVVNRFTGEIKEAEIFVMCWGYSQYIYAEAQEDQKLNSWLTGHVRGFAFFGCVSKLIVPDNYKGAVTKANRYDPDINPSYSELSEHYGVGVLPARPYHPKDKATVENSVLIVQRWILARLRNQVFHSIDELNKAIWKLLEELNNRTMQKFGKSRRELFEEVDKPNALPIPQNAFVVREWYTPSINLDYHIEIDKKYYSVPWHLYGKKVQTCIENNVLSVFLNGTQVAVHTVVDKPYHYSTIKEHMPPAHLAQCQWNAAFIYRQAHDSGPNTEALVKKIIAKRLYPEQGYRPAMGIVRLAKTYGNERLEAASEIASRHNLTRTHQIAEMLKNGKDLPVDEESNTIANTDNVRGQNYYN